MRIALSLLAMLSLSAAQADDVDELVRVILEDTTVIEDLQELTDTIGGRPTGSDANRKAVDWAADKFREEEIAFTKEDFTMPFSWSENSVSATVTGGDLDLELNVLSKAFSTGVDALEAPLLDGGTGSEADFERLGDTASGAWLLIETPVLDDKIGLAGLFGEFGLARDVDARALKVGAAGIIYMSSRPKNLVYRLPASRFAGNRQAILVMEREHALRLQRLLRTGHELAMTATIDVDAGDPYTATNVIAEIPGTTRPDEIVLFGAHLDSWGLGTGALDNGVNVAMLMNIARQITRLGLKPERTIRFALWNGEEQGLVGSWKYIEQHADELDNFIVGASFDIGSGRTNGFFTGGRPELPPLIDTYLEPVAELGPFQQIDIPLVGTDNYDFMVQGIPNLIAAQSDANYASNYHAESDTFEKVDQAQVRLNSAIAAAVIWGFANDTDRLPRQTRAEIWKLINSTDLETQMRTFAVWDAWVKGERGRND
ncbi:MAG: M28 family peptidase [Woeseiaceae bacterium]|nr:M28 family peptidase [Woeseiaceae bacterium]